MKALSGSRRGAVFTWGVATLKAAGIENPALDAAVLLGYVTGEPPETVLLERRSALALREASLYDLLVRKRCERVAVSRLKGEREFYSRKFYVTDDVLDPRPETETLVEQAILRLGILKRPPEILDIGTGSGVIAVTIASESPSARIIATDISMAALMVARRNAQRHSVHERICFVQADLLDGIRGPGRFDIILANPPYVSSAQYERLPKEVQNGDPKVALVSGPEGTEYYPPIVNCSREFLVRSGNLMVEVGDGQSAAVANIFQRAGFEDVQIVNDLAGRGRVVMGKMSDA